MTHSETTAPRFRTVDLAYIALFAVLMAVCAWITIPMTVPFTLQIFAVFAALVTLGGRRGTYAVVVYLLLGAVGLPVGAGFQGGLGWLLGTTGGYIVGFLCIALLYWLLTAKLGESLPVVIAACVLGLTLCYAFGTAWFMVVYAQNSGPVGLMTALGWCVFPYIIPDLVKLVLAVLLSRRVKQFLK
nr:biotin transporter BioY [uncultured Oscillibacter sp.]